MKINTTFIAFIILINLMSKSVSAQTQEIPNLFGQFWTIKLPSEQERLLQMSKDERKNYLQMPEETRKHLQMELEKQAENSFFLIKMDGTFDMDIKNYIRQKGSWKLDPTDSKILHIKYIGGTQDGQSDKIFIKELKVDKIILTLESQQITGQELVLVPRK